MNHVDRILDGYTWLWARAFEPLIGLLLIGFVAVLFGCFMTQPLAIAGGLAVFLLTVVLAWFHGENVDQP